MARVGSSCRGRSIISTGRKPAASGVIAGAPEPASGVYRGSRSHLKIIPLMVCKQTTAHCPAGHACMPERGATVCVHRVAPRDLRDGNARRRRLKADRPLLLVRPKPLRPTRHQTLHSARYPKRTLSDPRYAQQGGGAGRLRPAGLVNQKGGIRLAMTPHHLAACIGAVCKAVAPASLSLLMRRSPPCQLFRPSTNKMTSSSKGSGAAVTDRGAAAWHRPIGAV